ncbi:hypothetical protein [Microvirga tunisiensis]|uniref:Uncharacterized protein n=1 Tax=Microvirga tunisiensis TaxID=2108360 RepID=A0A5N7MLT9_9HYPH|nr:hypothetical protein [Microvirga tunisiensis]MPR09849.1 hypothetical protein [Microvirga tunisiensis]MPR28041.1 hypothetical protein [Microvirga tunisiensis]
MTTKTKQYNVQLDFRGEGYGSVFRPCAFRFGYLGDLSETRVNKLHAKARRCGFKFNHSRASWIKENVDDAKAEADKLIEAITEAGFTVTTNEFFTGWVSPTSGS